MQFVKVASAASGSDSGPSFIRKFRAKRKDPAPSTNGPGRYRKKGEEELVGSSPSTRNWRGILIAVLVILIVCSLIVVAVILVSPKQDTLVTGDTFTFEDMFSGLFSPRHFEAQWMKGKNVYVYRSREGEVMQYDANTNETAVIMDNSTFRHLNSDKMYFVSEDLQYVLVPYEVKHLYRHSITAKYMIFNRQAVDPREKRVPFPRESPQWSDKALQYAGWVPKGRGLTFVYGNNLYYQADPESNPIQITASGDQHLVVNGIPDWVYEEEILASNKAHWVSPDVSFICYAEFNDSNVPLYKFQEYGPGSNIYGTINEIPYPKAGEHREKINPTVKLYVKSMASLRGKATQILPPRELRDSEYYITMVTWQDDNHVMVAWANREQNKVIFTLCVARNGMCTTNHEEISSGGWVRLHMPLFVNKGSHYLTILPQRDGRKGYFRHIAYVTAPERLTGVPTFLTQGPYEVTQIVGYDQAENYVYYMSTNGDPRHRHLFRVGTPNSVGQHSSSECLTCYLDEDCQYFDASFSDSGQHYLLHCKGPGVPYTLLLSTIDDRNITVEDNADLRARLEKKAMPRKVYHQIEIEDGYKIWAQMLLPPSLIESTDHITKYPMLIYTYAGPGAQEVRDIFSIGWPTYLASTHHVIYVSIDGRGAGGQGDKFMHEIYRKLGTLEVEDQITAAQYLADNIHYIDKNRTAIWGWSYGGFVTSHVMGDRDTIINCGIAVAPVTDWRYYDTVYTERYMGLSNPSDNFRGYDIANVSSKAEYFKNKNFMLVHGTADDNVHFQNSAQLVKSLTDADVDFRIQVYTDKNHYLKGEHTSRHLYRTMTNFLKKTCWDGGVPRDVKPVVE